MDFIGCSGAYGGTTKKKPNIPQISSGNKLPYSGYPLDFGTTRGSTIQPILSGISRIIYENQRA
jgi:hypothetical protein